MPVRIISNQLGAGLIEVLMAFAVFSVGVMGSFSMQITAKKANYQAYQQSIAINFARDILSRMRANRTALDAYSVESFTGRNIPEGRDCTMEFCSNKQLAARDLFEWGSMLNGVDQQVTIGGKAYDSGGLVSPVACIEHNTGNVSVTISWNGFSKLTAQQAPSCGSSATPAQHRVSQISLNTYVGKL